MPPFVPYSLIYLDNKNCNFVVSNVDLGQIYTKTGPYAPKNLSLLDYLSSAVKNEANSTGKNKATGYAV